MDPFSVVIRPVSSESTLERIDKENRLTFLVNLKANRADIRQAVEILYEVKVEEVNTVITPKGEKKAFVKLAAPYIASEVAVKMGLL